MTDILFWILVGFAGFVVLLRLFFWLLIFPAWWKTEKQSGEQADLPPLSVVIASRNEAKNLKTFLPKVLEQDYPEFQVVVVDDCSEDNSREVLAELQNQYEHLYVTWVPQGGHFRRGKKVALSIGIRAAENDCLVFTDADCYPASDQWLRYMGAGYAGGNDVVLGLGTYQRRKSLLNALIHYDTMLIAMMYGGMAQRIKPYMGVGRNLAYKKSLWLEKGGFRGFSNTLSGDDDLFVNAYAQRKRTAVVFHPGAKTISEPATSFRDWRRQKVRHLGSSKRYPFWLKLLLVAEPLSRFITPFALAVLVWLMPIPEMLIAVPALYLILKALQFFVVCKSLKMTKESRSVCFYPIIDVFLPLIYVIFALGRLRPDKTNVWK
ncbi:MAG TPA: glycosyltransferase [Bacteroidales bacterium]|nr:glycosyltransferase [Bacteroidales bacterium]